MRSVVVTAANEQFLPLLRSLVESLFQWETSPFTDFACFDVGLSEETRRWLSTYTVQVLDAAWDLPVAAELRTQKPYLRAFTVRPFLPRYLPGYDVYLWIDADAWVQERFALEWYLEVSVRGPLAACPEVHHHYRQTRGVVGWRMDHMRRYFGADAAQRALWETYFNSGVFALRGDAPHWALWAKWFARGIENSGGTLYTDQTALNYALWNERLAVSALPATCNWLCHLAAPLFDAKQERFCEPGIPGRPLGLLHLAGESKDQEVAVHGATRERTVHLRFPGIKPIA